jgi:hypothetical protein
MSPLAFFFVAFWALLIIGPAVWMKLASRGMNQDQEALARSGRVAACAALLLPLALCGMLVLWFRYTEHPLLLFAIGLLAFVGQPIGLGLGIAAMIGPGRTRPATFIPAILALIIYAVIISIWLWMIFGRTRLW